MDFVLVNKEEERSAAAGRGFGDVDNSIAPPDRGDVEPVVAGNGSGVTDNSTNMHIGVGSAVTAEVSKLKEEVLKMKSCMEEMKKSAIEVEEKLDNFNHENTMLRYQVNAQEWRINALQKELESYENTCDEDDVDPFKRDRLDGKTCPLFLTNFKKTSTTKDVVDMLMTHGIFPQNVQFLKLRTRKKCNSFYVEIFEDDYDYMMQPNVLPGIYVDDYEYE